MAGLRERLRKKLMGLASGGRAAQLAGLEERATNPTASEKVVVRPDKKVTKKKRKQ